MVSVSLVLSPIANESSAAIVPVAFASIMKSTPASIATDKLLPKLQVKDFSLVKEWETAIVFVIVCEQASLVVH